MVRIARLSKRSASRDIANRAIHVGAALWPYRRRLIVTMVPYVETGREVVARHICHRPAGATGNGSRQRVVSAQEPESEPHFEYARVSTGDRNLAARSAGFSLF